MTSYLSNLRKRQGSGLHVVERPGSGPTIVLLHGLGGTHRYWLSVMDQVNFDSHLIMVDLLGFGDSPKPYCRYTVDLHLEALKEALGDRKNLTLVGHSLGAALALAYSARYPETVNRLILISCPYFGDKHTAYRWLRHKPSGWLLTNMMTTALTCLITRGITRQILLYILKDYPAEVVDDLVKHNVMSSTTSLWEVLYRYDLNDDAKKLPKTLPVICIHAEDDISAPVEGIKRLVRLHSNWRLILLDGTGHQPWLRAPKSCADIILGVPLMTHTNFITEF
ncbi:alpha/beta fold hydrolase [Alkalimarinus alittae]|uniref:Alpha/beta hydrolase n=1 Tax=Alkalimarinus alittae TaxID=2961619 RepID=A0ABY6MXD4_9ALTE|nr:alpha/beta hydrolase [Alkalimarinus alittae]UZE94503.1 alpha/beta hydrolase [Alkalimarinus alittae]